MGKRRLIIGVMLGMSVFPLIMYPSIRFIDSKILNIMNITPFELKEKDNKIINFPASYMTQTSKACHYFISIGMGNTSIGLGQHFLFYALCVAAGVRGDQNEE
ncbi:hypothetical protein IEQ34_003171 [Dendrobium chrysotoxum]|uniref:Uncharacterized protein n=1 Tax=Dendrobium chrysotoxum TaxID=161865 RepID=A0AAV7HKX9_DENCH|nr:hypothetical protein IEQ34_003171 [Dendrobium chrysotoxum]